MPPVGKTFIAAAAISLIGVPVTPSLAWCDATRGVDAPEVITVRPTVETAPVPSQEDAADDPAVWVHPIDAALSLIIGTDKRSGLFTYNLDGSIVQSIPGGTPNNVDVRDGFMLDGVETSIVVATNTTDDLIQIFAVDPDSRTLRSVRADTLSIRPLEGIYGMCLYKSPATDDLYVFVNNRDGEVRQYLLFESAPGVIDARLVRELRVDEKTEGMVADDQNFRVFIGEEENAIWSFVAEPTAPSTLTLVDRIGPDGRLSADIEGLALYSRADGTGYLIASVQEDDRFAVYNRVPPHEYITSFTIGTADGIDEVTHTDGIELISAPLGAAFPRGVFIAQDDENPGSTQNFKLVPLDRVLRIIRAAEASSRDAERGRLIGPGRPRRRIR